MSTTKSSDLVLVADPDSSFLESMRTQSHSKILLAPNGKEAQEIIQNKSQHFSGIFLNEKLSQPDTYSLIQLSHQFHPEANLYLLHETPVPHFSLQELAELRIKQTIRKPISFEDIRTLVPTTKMDSERIQNEEETSAKDADFFSVNSSQFLTGTNSSFDLYVRLSADNYIKIMYAGDGFTEERLKTYINKGVTAFYIKNIDQDRYLSYRDQISSALINSPTISTEVKIERTFQQGEELLGFLRNQGIKEIHLQYGAAFIGKVNALAKQMNFDRHAAFKTFMEDVAAYDHGVGSAMISCFLCHPLGIDVERGIQIVGLACLFHDIGLYSIAPHLQDEDESKMNESEKKLYHTHPTVGAELLQKIPRIDPATIQAVAQHHEKRDRKGFPLRLGAASITQIAQIVQISDEFIHLIKKSKTNPSIQPLQEMELRVFDGFSKPVVKAFKEFFFLTLL